MSTPNPMLMVPMCWLDNQHIPDNIVEYAIVDDKILPLYGVWYCKLCKARLDNRPYHDLKHERFREM
jgi:hypothetical protein